MAQKKENLSAFYKCLDQNHRAHGVIPDLYGMRVQKDFKNKWGIFFNHQSTDGRYTDNKIKLLKKGMVIIMQSEIIKQNNMKLTDQNNRKQSMNKFITLVIGQFISSIGSGLTDFGLAIFVFAMTKSVTATAMVSICAFLPSILLAPLGGVLADHYDRRMMMILGELFSAFGLMICLLTVMSDHPSLAIICIGVGVSSVFTALMEPAFKATVTDLLSEEDFHKAGGMVQIAGSAKLLISPAIAGLLLKITAVSTLILIDILTFFTTVFIIVLVKKDMVTKHKNELRLNIKSEMKEGIAVIRGNRGIIAIVVIMTISVFCLGFVQILSRPLILAFAGKTELGFLATVSAMGMMVGSIAISCKKSVKSHVKMLSIGLFSCGIFMAFMGVWQNLFLITLFGFLMFVSMPAIQIGAEVLIRKSIANEVQGRAFGMISFLTQMGYIFAYLLSGVLADYVFEPLMCGNSQFARRLGAFIGNGVGSGVALLLILAGTGMAIVGMIASRIKSVKEMERKENHQYESIVESCSEGL